MNSKVKTLNLQAASTLAAISLSLTGYSALAESSSQAASQAAAQSSSQAASQSSSHAGTQTATATGTKTTTAVAPGTPASPTTVPKGPDLVALQGPTLITQKGTGWKTTTGFIELKDGQQALPLTFTLTNGAGNQQKMQGIRVSLNGREILNEKAFKGKDALSMNLSDVLAAGQSQLIINTYGPNGATLNWVLTTLKIKVSDIKPVNCKIGETVKISGKNFPTDKTAYKLTVENQPATIAKASSTSLDFVVPTGLTGGKKTVTLYIAGVKCDPLYIKIAAAPEVTGCNLLGAAPGGQVIIQGKGFSTVSGENLVVLKTPDGQVISTVTPTEASDSALTVTLPMDFPCPSEILCTVKTNGQESAKGITFSCSQRVIDKGLLN